VKERKTANGIITQGVRRKKTTKGEKIEIDVRGTRFSKKKSLFVLLR